MGFEGITTEEFRISKRVKQTHLISTTNLVLEVILRRPNFDKKKYYNQSEASNTLCGRRDNISDFKTSTNKSN